MTQWRHLLNISPFPYPHHMRHPRSLLPIIHFKKICAFYIGYQSCHFLFCTSLRYVWRSPLPPAQFSDTHSAQSGVTFRDLLAWTHWQTGCQASEQASCCWTTSYLLPADLSCNVFSAVSTQSVLPAVLSAPTLADCYFVTDLVLFGKRVENTSTLWRLTTLIGVVPHR